MSSSMYLYKYERKNHYLITMTVTLLRFAKKGNTDHILYYREQMTNNYLH